MTDIIASDLAARRALRDWAKDKPEHIHNLAKVIRAQLRILGTFRNTTGGDALRSIIAENIKRLAAGAPR